MSKVVKYTTIPLTLDPRGGATPSDCKDILFINYGDYDPTNPTGENLIVNDVVVVYPGCTYEVKCESGEELLVSRFKYKFSDGGGAKNGVVVRKVVTS